MPGLEASANPLPVSPLLPLGHRPSSAGAHSPVRFTLLGLQSAGGFWEEQAGC